MTAITITTVVDDTAPATYSWNAGNEPTTFATPFSTDDTLPTISGTADAGAEIGIWVTYETYDGVDFVPHQALIATVTADPVTGAWGFQFTDALAGASGPVGSFDQPYFDGIYSITAQSSTNTDPPPVPFFADSPSFFIQVTENVVCFLPGTLIATAAGEQPIESLVIGDMITLAGGTQKPVKWLGRMTVKLNRFNRHSASPILIRAGALGGGLPKRDLYTSYRHGFAVNGVLVIAGLLVNGTSIVQCSDWKESSVTFYQVEVEGHELMLAEGAASETFGEDGDNRELFDNAGEFHAMYPNAIAAEPMPMGRVVASRQIPRAVKATIEAAAVEMGYVTWAAAA